MQRRPWSREELILAINLYYKIPFGQLHNRNHEIIELAALINRTPSAVSWKLVNFASFDSSLQDRGIKGAQNASKLDREIWDEFYTHLDLLSFESEMLLLERHNTKNNIDLQVLGKEGKDKVRDVKTRVNQSFFRSTILASYNNRCCITGLSNPEFLIASHIVPWSIDKKNRLNPQNGLLLNALHDKAFEFGFLTILPDYMIRVCSELLKSNEANVKNYFHKYHETKMELPSRFLPNVEFLKYHNQERFRQ
ncbi:HNH endonuclease [bacterium]|nr:HNH endonuclease [bacterium]